MRVEASLTARLRRGSHAAHHPTAHHLATHHALAHHPALAAHLDLDEAAILGDAHRGRCDRSRLGRATEGREASRHDDRC